ncbi:MAG: phytoene desaturase [Deltaproteobacteria bacterium]|nr:phytoene desaturase [Deltaproteobacteria bacterium]
MAKFDAAVIGAGMGGLSASITLASQGQKVLLLEAQPQAGGKAGSLVLDGVRVDTGPSVLTLIDVFDALLRTAGTRLGEVVSLVRPNPAFRYLYADGAELDLYFKLTDTLKSIRDTLGARAEREFEAFMQYAARIWESASRAFVYGPAPSFAIVLLQSFRALGLLSAIDPLHTMQQAIESRIQSPHLRMLLSRYATYNGSDVRRAPATLNCIAHVELAMGGYGVEGGIYRLVEALVQTARKQGVTIQTETRVRKILLEKRRVVGVVLNSGERIEASCVIANADATQVAEALLPEGARHGISLDNPASMSGYNAIIRAARRRTAPRGVAHCVVFPADYQKEFSDIFERNTVPVDPAVYLCAPEVCHRAKGWPEHEPLFIMSNAPAQDETSDSSEADELAIQRMLERLRAARLIEPGDEVVWRRAPKDLAVAFPGSRGSIYGAASNSRTAAFHRPPNKIKKIAGLYLASASAHPGGGLPLAALSGTIAARAALADLKK